MQSTLANRSLSFADWSTYSFAALFIIGNMVFPQLFHLVPQGGMIWLPIYFFTLIGAYLCGWRVGLLTAIASPVVNCLLFDMPLPSALPAIITKSVILALMAGYASWRLKRVTLTAIAAIVIGYQAFGSLGEWVQTGDFSLACQDFRIGVPGMLLQLTAGYLIIRYATKKLK